MALLVCFVSEVGQQPSPPSVASLGIEVSLDTDLGRSESARRESNAEPPDVPKPVRETPVRGPSAAAGLDTRTASPVTDSTDPGEGIVLSHSVYGGLGRFGAAGSGSALRGVSRAPLTGGGTARGEGLMPRADKSARLAPGSTACADLFPYEAGVTRGEVTATLDVDSEGRAKLVKLERAIPTARGFEAAASACAMRLRFEPARDGAGRTVASMAQVKLVFQREG